MPKGHMLQLCWTVRGDEDFRQSLDEMCMSLNDLAEQGAAVEVTFTMWTLMRMGADEASGPATISSCFLWAQPGGHHAGAA